MKRVYILLLVGSILSSCMMTDKMAENFPAPCFVASLEADNPAGDTKTIMRYDQTTGTSHVYWSPNDELNVFFGTKSVKYHSCNTEYSSSSLLKTDETLSESDLANMNRWGLYPYNPNAKFDGTKISTSLSASQIGIPGSFEDDLAIMVARSVDTTMFFMNVCSGLKFSLTRDDIKAVSISGNDGEKLAGSFDITFESDVPMTTSSNGVRTITLRPADGDFFLPNEDYLIMMLPADMPHGFTILFEMDNARGEFMHDGGVRFPRNDLGVKRAIDTYANFYFDVTDIELDRTSARMRVGDVIDIMATITPENATDKTVEWTSSDENVVQVNDGRITALTIGTATVTAKSGEKKATCEITVEATPVESITLDEVSASLRAGQSITLIATVNPSDATDKTVTWSTSDATVATVENGVVTALKVGTATITAKAGEKTATCTITVVATPVTSVTLDKTTASLRAGQTVTLTATVNPSDATDKTVTWSTSDASVATVENGVVTALKVGTATITAKAGDKTASCTVTVEAIPVNSIVLNKTSVQLRAGQIVTLVASVYPSNATDKTVIWTTSNAQVATVTGGVVKAIEDGNAVITAKVGGKTASCTVIVKTEDHTGGGLEDVGFDSLN